MAATTSNPIIWEDERIRFTVDWSTGDTVATLVGDHTDEESSLAALIISRAVTLVRALGVRASNSEARVAELQILVGEGSQERDRLRKSNEEYRDRLPTAEARVAELEAAELVRWCDSKPDVGRHFVVYELWDNEPILAERHKDGSCHVVSNGLEVNGDASLDDTMDEPISDQSLWAYVPTGPEWIDDFTDGVPTWRKSDQRGESR